MNDLGVAFLVLLVGDHRACYCGDDVHNRGDTYVPPQRICECFILFKSTLLHLIFSLNVPMEYVNLEEFYLLLESSICWAKRVCNL